MYTPDYFLNRNREKIKKFLEKNSFGILLSINGDNIENTGIPFIFDFNSDRITLYGHMARNNQQWRTSVGKKVTVLFLGPHHYISPRWYIEESSVPTWDYVIIRMTGPMELVDRENTENILKRLSDRFDKEWSDLKKEKESYYQNMIREIVAFKIDVNETIANWKMSQNHSKEDISNVIENLERLGTSESIDTAREIRDSNS